VRNNVWCVCVCVYVCMCVYVVNISRIILLFGNKYIKIEVHSFHTLIFRTKTSGVLEQRTTTLKEVQTYKNTI